MLLASATARHATVVILLSAVSVCVPSVFVSSARSCLCVPVCVFCAGGGGVFVNQ